MTEFLSSMHIPEISYGTLIQGLRLLYDFYKDRRERAEKSDSDPDPDPEKLKEIIKELQLKAQHAEPSSEEISQEIDRKLGTKQAERVKEDLSMLGLLSANPPDLSKRNYFGILSDYASGMLATALRHEIFKLYGHPTSDGKNSFLKLTATSAVIFPDPLVNKSLRPDRMTIASQINDVTAFLVTGGSLFPVRVLVRVTFTKHAIVETITVREEALFDLWRGPSSNWLQLRTDDNPSFQSVVRQLRAADVRNIMAAMKSDVLDYVKAAQDEDAVVDEIHGELQNLRTKLS